MRPWQQAGTPKGWSLPHTFGWHRIKTRKASDLQVWERPDGSTLHHEPSRGRLICRRRKDGMVVHGVERVERVERAAKPIAGPRKR